MSEVNKGHQSEMDTANRILESKRESTNVIATIALTLSMPGPLLVALSHFSLGGDLNSILYYIGLAIGLLCNSLSMLWGVLAIKNWKGIGAVVISFLWWLWVFGAWTNRNVDF